MPERPLLILPIPGEVGRRSKHGGPSGLQWPGRSRQGKRIGPRFKKLAEAFAKRRAELQLTMAGAAPEEVLVIEIVGTVARFLQATRQVAGLEWLAEVELDAADPDDDFFVAGTDGAPTAKPVEQRMFLVFSDDQARKQLLSLWRMWRREEPLPRGLAPLRDVFLHLRDIRVWDVRDRLAGTGVLEDWSTREAAGAQTVLAEVELWFRKDADRRQAAAARVESLVGAAHGHILHQAAIDAIAYHALLVRLPIAEVRGILDDEETQLVRCEAIQLFRPTGQAAAPPAPDERTEDNWTAAAVPTVGDPVAALFDGLPLENHQRLAGRLVVDDPDGFANNYPTARRLHGTAMASLILHGDLNANSPLAQQPLYVRPILKPHPFVATEFVPEDVLLVDLVHRAVRRLFETQDGAAAPTVRIVNFSIGDPSQPFGHSLSPLARLIDWLAHRFGVLFLVSAGNHHEPIQIGVSPSAFAALAADELQRRTLVGLSTDKHNRRILAPAESVNALTIGALHDDSSTVAITNARELLTERQLPSPINSIGFGFRKAVKPDLHLAGGRIVHEPRLGTSSTTSAPLEVSRRGFGPGIRTAAPGPLAGDLTRSTHTCGTSNATALATRAAIHLHDVLLDLRTGPGSDLIDDIPIAAWIKALLVHGASWGQGSVVLNQALTSVMTDPKYRRAEVTRFVGFGSADPARVVECTARRVTALSGGRLGADAAHIHRLPIPQSLAGVAAWRRLTVTLAWLTPVNPRNQRWSVADLWFDAPGMLAGAGLESARKEVDASASQRGTVQHEVFEGDHVATAAGQGNIEVQVNCRADGGTLESPVAYAMAITLEVAESLQVDIYSEIRAQVQAQVQVTP